jgi:hypothetical protein
MGQHCEEMAKEWQVSRREQDEVALASHKNAAAAWKSGFFNDLVVPFGDLKWDNNVRADTSLEKLASLRNAFDPSPAGTLSAGNSSPLTDGAASVLLASEEWASSKGFKPLAYVTFTETAAVDFVGMAGPKEGMLMAPAYAVPRMLDRAGIKLQDFDIYEIHEAFAAQVLCTLKAWESEKFCRDKLKRAALGPIDRSKMNPKGSSVALGHPFAATGARIVATLAKQLAERGSGRGLISICAAGGMGVTAILEALERRRRVRARGRKQRPSRAKLIELLSFASHARRPVRPAHQAAAQRDVSRERVGEVDVEPRSGRSRLLLARANRVRRECRLAAGRNFQTTPKPPTRPPLDIFSLALRGRRAGGELERGEAEAAERLDAEDAAAEEAPVSGTRPRRSGSRTRGCSVVRPDEDAAAEH